MNWKLVLAVFVAALIAALIANLIVKQKVYSVDGKTQTGLMKPSLSSSPAKAPTA